MPERPDFHPDFPPDWPKRPSWPPHFRHPHQPFMRHQRPTWWPENEPWPPVGRFRRNPFFRRLGCLFVVFNLFGAALFISLALFIAHLSGLIHLNSDVVQWTLPLGVVALVFLVPVLVVIVFALRRIFSPLDSLLQAAGRVAAGDYSTRVPEKGPGGVRSLTRAFNNMAARLHQVDEQRRNLLADVTHELRTPLTVIQGNLEGMLDGLYPADETNLRALLEETNILSRLVEDLRTLALAESGALQLKKEPTDLAMLVRETLAVFRAQASAAGVTLNVETADDLPLLEIDPGRMRQVLSNLAANALRYTPAGGGLRVSVSRAEGYALVEVQDSGHGIPADELPHIFERFYKSTDSGGNVPPDAGGKVPHDPGGMGLGLAIARHLVSAHGGQIEAESPPGQGTTIRISLPIDTE